MPPSIGRWLDWVMTDVLPLNRNRPRGSAIQVRYEKAGRWLEAAPVPWNADAVQVDVTLRLTPAARQRSFFTLKCPNGESFAPDSMRCESGDRHRLVFALPVPAASCSATLFWKTHAIARLDIPVLTAAEFLAELNASLPTVFVKLGSRFVSAHAFVPAQCNGLAASVVLRSPVPLAPLADLGLFAVFRNERTRLENRVPVSLSGAQLAACEATATAALPRLRRSSGTWSVAWFAGERELARDEIHAIRVKRFEQSLQVTDARFLVADKRGRSKLVKQLAPADRGTFGPAFLLASSEAGIAAIAHLAIHATGPHADALPMVTDALVTDGIALVSAEGFDATTLHGTTGFELRLRNRVLGFVSLSPVPAAKITAEGGFKPPPDFVWTGVADEELNERLNRLMKANNGERRDVSPPVRCTGGLTSRRRLAQEEPEA